MGVLIYLGLLAIYECLPVPIQAIVFLADLFVPDPIPFFDELILFIGLVGKLAFVTDVLDFITEPIGCLVTILIICAVIGFAIYGFIHFAF